MALGPKVKGFLVFLVLAAVVAGWQATYYLFHHGYSTGSRTGVLRKLSIKGPPYCKYVSGDMVLQGNLPGAPLETWEFTVSDVDKALLMPQLEVAEKSGKPVTLRYRQDLKMWWRCTPLEFYVTDLEK